MRPPPPGKRTILIVDDDEMLRGIYEAVFKEYGFEVLLARDGAEAWDMLNSGKVPAAVLTGIIMPRLGGFELVTKMRAHPTLQSVPVAIISHRGLPEDEKKAHDLGVRDFIVQNTTPPPEVVRRINVMLGLQNQFRITFLADRGDGEMFVRYLNREQITNCSSREKKEMLLEIEMQAEKGAAKIQLIC